MGADLGSILVRPIGNQNGRMGLFGWRGSEKKAVSIEEMLFASTDETLPDFYSTLAEFIEVYLGPVLLCLQRLCYFSEGAEPSLRCVISIVGRLVVLSLNRQGIIWMASVSSTVIKREDVP